MNEPTLTHAECHLVKHLIDLWHASYNFKQCRHDCECPICKAMEEAGSHNSSTFESLHEKVESVLK